MKNLKNRKWTLAKRPVGMVGEHNFAFAEEEVRDIYVTRNINDGWESPVSVHDDGWVIYGCPVNGPKVVSSSNNIAVRRLD